MSHWLTRVSGLCLSAAVLLTSCEKEGDQVTLQQSGTAALTASSSTLVLSSANASAQATTLTWQPMSYGYQAAITNTIQIDKKGNNFANPIEVPAGSANTMSFTVSELNALALRAKATAGSATQLEVRVKSMITSKVAATYSPTTTLTVTPYLVVINYPVVYVPGNHQGWAPATAPKLAAFNSNNNQLYEGFVNMTDAAPAFKITSMPSWSGVNYGDATGGKLSTDGGASDLKLPAPGYYRLKADLGALTLETVKTTWSIIGAATPGGWTTDTPLVYDAATGTWSARMTLTAGPVKFRANNDWTINFGDGNAKATPAVAADGVLEYGADDIMVPAAGTFTVTLDLSKPGNYTYSIK